MNLHIFCHFYAFDAFDVYHCVYYSCISRILHFFLTNFAPIMSHKISLISCGSKKKISLRGGHSHQWEGGQQVGEAGGLVDEEMPSKMQGKLVVGKWNYTFTGKEEQFLWSVTNFQIFKGSASVDLAMLTKDLCKRRGDILAWETMRWKVEGDKMEEVEERAEEVCSQPTTYKLLLSQPKYQEEAISTCDKLGHGSKDRRIVSETELLEDIE